MTGTTNSEQWGSVDGQEVRLWTLSYDNDLGPMTIRVSEYGAILQAIQVQDRAGVTRDLVLGHDSLAD